MSKKERPSKRIHVCATALKNGGGKSSRHFFEREVFHLTLLDDFLSYTPFFKTSVALSLSFSLFLSLFLSLSEKKGQKG